MRLRAFCLRHECPLIFGRVHHRGTVLSTGMFRAVGLSANCKETGSAASGRPTSREIFRNVDQSYAKRGSRTAGCTSRHGSLVVELMRRCASLFFSFPHSAFPVEGVVLPCHPPLTLLSCPANRVILFFFDQCAFFRKYSTVYKILSVFFFFVKEYIFF